MQKYVVIYNPSAGKGLAQQKVFNVAKNIMSQQDSEITFYATKRKNDAFLYAKKACENNFDVIIASGGDGTIHEVVNGIMQSENKSKLAILPTGTVNDFANELKIPKSTTNFTKLLLKNKFKKVDIGKANEKYFVNVVGGGAFTNIPHHVPSDTKTVLGKYAYYFQAAVEIPGQLEKSYSIKYTFNHKILTIKTALFLISNTSSVGGFKHLSPKAKYNDGLLDVIIIEKGSPSDMIQIFTGILNGKHVNHKKVHYIQSNNITIETNDDITLDIDGEIGVDIPVNIISINNAMEILSP